jgi:oligopeptide transport system substrate-binding protein
MRAVWSFLFLAPLLASCGSKTEPTSAAKPVKAVLSTFLKQEPIPDRIAYARQLLAEAGYPGGKGLPKLEVLYNTDEGHKKIAAAIQQMWNKNLGVDVELRNSEWKVYLDDLSKLRYQVGRRGWIGDYRDPYTFIELMKSDSGNNNTGWSDLDFDRLALESGAEADPARRYEILRQAEAILLCDLPVLPLYYYVSQAAWTDKVKGVYQNIMDYHPLNEAYVEGSDTIVINNGTEIQALDPALARGVPEHRVLNAVYEGLTRSDPRTYDPLPGVAETWDISKDGKTYTFHLRECAWSDGKKVTAHDFVFAWRRILNPAFPSDYAHMLHVVKGAEPYNSKKTSDPLTVAVEAKDDRTFVVELEHPVPYFPELVTHYAFHPLRKDVLEKHGDAWTRTENIVTNGPFKVKEWRPNEHVLLEKNDGYWGSAKTKTHYVKFLPIDNRLTAWNLYLTGKCDWVTTLPVEKMEEIIKRPDYHGATYLGIYYWSFNCTKPPLNDRRVRKALTLALDRDIIVKRIALQGQVPAYGFVPPMFDAYKSPRFDVKD